MQFSIHLYLPVGHVDIGVCVRVYSHVAQVGVLGENTGLDCMQVAPYNGSADRHKEEKHVSSITPK